MSEFNCPYCNQEGEPDYDDHSWHTDSDEGIEYECGSCERKYLVTVSTSVHYEATCLEHEWGVYERYTQNPDAHTLEHFEKMEQHAWCKNCHACGDLEDIVKTN